MVFYSSAFGWQLMPGDSSLGQRSQLKESAVTSQRPDRVDGFVAGQRVEVAGKPGGSLAGLRFAAKDIFDVAGHVTGGGNPDWARTHSPAKKTAPAVQALLDAGAFLVGKTVTDELTRGILGINVFDGTPENPKAPDRVPGGSSSGSASVVASGAVDFALGSDTGGSVRIPASFCGIYGIRPSYGRVPIASVIEQAPSFDTVGWFAREVDVLTRVGQVLLSGTPATAPFTRLIVAEDAFAVADEEVRQALAPAVDALRALAPATTEEVVAPDGLGTWRAAMMTVQQWEAHRSFADWIDRVNPRFAYEVAQRFVNAAATSDADLAAAKPVREAHRQRMAELLRPGTVVALPTAPRTAPRYGLRVSEMQDVRRRIIELTCIAGGTGAAQVSLPAAEVDGLPVGFSLIAAAGADEMLLALAQEMFEILV